jgi:hypothetical protein
MEKTRDEISSMKEGRRDKKLKIEEKHICAELLCD